MQKQSKPQGILVISILTMITGIILISVGFLYLSSTSNSINPFLMMFEHFIQIFAFINLILSLSFFANYYGLIKAIEWSRSIAIKLFFIFIIIGLINIFINFIIPDDFTLITNVNQYIVTILSSIGICCSIIGLFFLYRSNIKIYYYQLKVIHEQEINNINSTFPILSTNKITFYLTSFLIAHILMEIIGSFQSFGIIGNIEQDPTSLSNILMGIIIPSVIYGGTIIFPIWWFSRTYTNLKKLGIPGLDFSAIRVALSFFIPIRNLYEPVKLLKTLWQASSPYINDLKWKDVVVPTGLGLWWFLVLASVISDVRIFDSSGSLNVFIESIQTILGLIFTPMASIATILIVRKINARMVEKIDKTNSKIFNPDGSETTKND